jgi:hypothetical protein
MGKKLAIRGHSTRGKEVIEILEMMGGKNKGYIGIDCDEFYTIEDGYIIQSYDWNDCLILSLEEFLEKYPFKVGDKVKDCYGNPVTIKSMSWHDGFETIVYDFEETEDVLCAEDIESVNDIHTKPSKMKIVLAELLEHIKTTPKEELEREFEELEEWSNVGPTVEEFRTFCECVNKKPKYPKTYEKCCKILDYNGDYFLTTYDNNGNPSVIDDILKSVNVLTKLLICRNAYWKIAGEQMGLDKPWKPDWNNISDKYTIYPVSGEIWLDKGQTINTVLAFPTVKMRDAFYENFKDLIDQCKKLL